jgi:hypothetical protein
MIKFLPSATRGALFEKTAPLDPPQKLFIGFFCLEVVFIFVYLRVTSWLIYSVSSVPSVAKESARR